MSLMPFFSDSISQEPHRERRRERSTVFSCGFGMLISAVTVVFQRRRIVPRSCFEPSACWIGLVFFTPHRTFRRGDRTRNRCDSDCKFDGFRAQLGTTYFAGDSFILAVHGAANQLVTVSQTRGKPHAPGCAVADRRNGDLAVPGTWTTADVGTYTQT